MYNIFTLKPFFTIVISILVSTLVIVATYQLYIYLYSSITETYAQNDPIIINLKNSIQNILNEKSFEGYLSPLNNRDIFKEISIHKGDKSYTINKTKIYLCLTDKDGTYYDNNMLMYVLLHEISHCICDEIGHTEKFHNTFNALLDHAIKSGIYNPTIPIITNYCPS